MTAAGRVLILCALAAYAAPPVPLSPQERLALDHISANSLRGHLSFIASDSLEGRNTPSRGLDLAAEYIAAQFRRAGLEPAGDDGYFQTAEMKAFEPAPEGFAMSIEHDGQTMAIPRDQITPRFYTALELSGAALYKVDREGTLNTDEVHDKVVVTELPDFEGAAKETIASFRALRRALAKAKPLLTLLFTRQTSADSGPPLALPQSPVSDADFRIVVRSPEAFGWYTALAPGPSRATLTVRLPAPLEKPVKVHNVVGLLRGADPVLKDTYVLLTAHYDHIGVKPDGAGDRVYNGANDDGSGTVSVIEIASALAALNPPPKRSIVFMTFFGEEEGLLGSRYYAEHAVFPISKTVADVNLEQVGRTDATDGRKLAQGTFTGYPYSDLPRLFQAAGARVGVRVLSDEQYGDAYFARSDNAPLADQGVPAHTLAVAIEFPDYHAVGDKWQKIDYANMAKVDRMVALGLMMLANNPRPPRWDTANPKTERYVKAWEEHRAGNVDPARRAREK